VEVGREYPAIRGSRSEISLKLQKGMLSFFPVHGVRWDNINMLCLRYDRRNYQELQYSPSCSLCRRQQYISSGFVHLSSCSRLWRSHKPHNYVHYHLRWVNRLFSWYFVFDRADNGRCSRWRVDKRKSWIAINSCVSKSMLKHYLLVQANNI